MSHLKGGHGSHTTLDSNRVWGFFEQSPQLARHPGYSLRFVTVTD
jgi:hypothetical protein